MTISPGQCRAARGLLDWSQQRLSDESKVGAKTIVDFEQGRRTPFARTIRDLREAFEAAGIEFTNGDAPGLRLKIGAARGKSNDDKDEGVRRSKRNVRRVPR